MEYTAERALAPVVQTTAAAAATATESQPKLVLSGETGNTHPALISDRHEGDVDVTSVEEYRFWKPRALPNPLSGDESEIMEGLLEIIAAEGPMTRKRAFRIYTRAAGSRMRDSVVPVLHRALTRALRRRLIEQKNESGSRDPLNQVVRKAGAPDVCVRTRGDRDLDEIPRGEISALADMIRGQQPALTDDQVLRSVQEHYGIGRMTDRLREVLDATVRRRLDLGRRLHIV